MSGNTRLKVLLSFLILCYNINVCISAVSFSATNVCYGNATMLVNTSNIPGTASVLWDLNNDGFYNDASGDTVNYIFPTQDTVYVALEITDSAGQHYYSMSAVAVEVYPLPVLDFSYTGTCLGGSTNFFNHSLIDDSTSLNYQWKFSSFGPVNSTLSNPVNQYSATGSYSAQLLAVSVHGCADSIQHLIHITQPPHTAFTYNNDTCANLQVQFVNSTQIFTDSLTQILWNFGDSLIDFRPDTLYHRYATDGNYTVVLKVLDNNGCSDSAAASIKILPAVNYNYSYSNDSAFYPGKSTTVTVTGSFTSILWNDSSSSAIKTITDSGFYTFTVSNGVGCAETRTLYAQLLNAPVADIQRANDFITPNGDGINDVLYFKNIESYTTCDVKVYDAQGVEVYSSNAYQNDWDGKQNGHQLNAGSYYYIIKCDEFSQLTGVTNIIR